MTPFPGNSKSSKSDQEADASQDRRSSDTDVKRFARRRGARFEKSLNDERAEIGDDDWLAHLHHAHEEPMSDDVSEDGSAAVLQGVMTMLGEVLGRLDSRLAALEASVAEQPTIQDLDFAALAALDRVAERLEAASATRYDEARTAVVAGLDSPSERLEELKLGVARRDSDALSAVAASLEGLSKRLEQLEARRANTDGHESAVVASLERLSERLERLESEGVPAGTVEAALSRLEELAGAVDTIGYGVATLADMVTSTERWDHAQVLQTTLAAVGVQVAELRGSLLDHVEVLGRIDLEVQALRAQPGPGPALAVVAAGLAERFEERTQAITDLLDANAEYSGRLWQRIEELLDGGGLDDLVVGEALEHVIDQLQSLTDLVHQALAAQGAPPAALEAVPTTLTTLASTVERLRLGLDDLRGRQAALMAGIDSLRQEGHVPLQSGPVALGRRATEVGRRWASDLGLRSRENER